MTIYDQLKASTSPLMAKFKNPTVATWERYTRTPDGGGGATVAWSSQGSINIIVIPVNPGSRENKADAVISSYDCMVYALYDDASTITAKDRFVFGSKTLAIVGEPVNIVEGGMWIKFRCSSKVTT